MKKRDSDKNPFEKKNLVKLAPAAVVIAAVAAAGVQAGSSGKEVTSETREVVKSQDLESLLKTAYSYEAADDEAEEESLLKAGKNTSSASSKKKTSKISKKKSGIKKGSSKTLPVKTAASSGVGQGSTTTPTTEVPEGGYKDGTYQGSGTGFGGTIKNIGMGCGSRAGKMKQHASGKPAIHEDLCRGCRRCAKECGSDAITYQDKKAVIDYDKCKGCGRCIGACNYDAVYNPNSDANELLDRKMAEYAQAVCHDRPCFHISLVQDVSPNCDCHGENDAPILPNIGMFASFDPIALDQACADACLKAKPLDNSQLGDHLAEPGWHCHHDHFKDSNPNIEWKATLDQGEKIGLGSREYELKILK